MELHEMTTYIAAQVRALGVVRSTVSTPNGKIRIRTEEDETFTLQIEKEISPHRLVGEGSSVDGAAQSP